MQASAKTVTESTATDKASEITQKSMSDRVELVMQVAPSEKTTSAFHRRGHSDR